MHRHRKYTNLAAPTCSRIDSHSLLAISFRSFKNSVSIYRQAPSSLHKLLALVVEAQAARSGHTWMLKRHQCALHRWHANRMLPNQLRHHHNFFGDGRGLDEWKKKDSRQLFYLRICSRICLWWPRHWPPPQALQNHQHQAWTLQLPTHRRQN